LKGISLFSSAGIGEMYLKDIGINIVAANELIVKRADCYKFLHPESEMIQGDIRSTEIQERIKGFVTDDVNFLLATPPCQGLSTLGKNKSQEHFEKDQRNFLIFDVLKIIDDCKFDYVLIENVPRFIKMLFPYKDSFFTLEEILIDKYSHEYIIEVQVLDAKDFGVPQTRPRAILKLYRKNHTWSWPEKESEISLKDSIGHLPSLDAGESSPIKWHHSKPHNVRAVKALSYTPTGKSALKNEIHYPKKENGERIKGFHNTFKRMVWDQPSHARTTYSGSISSHNNVHPGVHIGNGLYSDARVLTLLETFIVSSIPEDIDFPSWASETFIRTVIGESIPPLMLKKILKVIV
jgi:DNA (cytosine-5)-methyltransferase 1